MAFDPRFYVNQEKVKVRRIYTGRDLWAGVVAGMIAALAMGLVAMIRAGVEGMGFWFPMKLIAATYFGVDALIGAAGVAILGVVTHLVVGGIYGAIFSLLVNRTTAFGSAFAGGLLYGVGVWIVMTYVGLPLVNEIMLERVYGLTPTWWFVYHLVFGGVLSITPSLRKKFAATGRTEMAEERRPSEQKRAA